MGRVHETTEENKAKGETVKVRCLKCNHETRHLVRLSLDESGDEQVDEDCVIWWTNSSQIIECQGCETVSFRQLSTFSEEDCPSERLYPIRAKNKIALQDYWNMPPTLRRIYKEIIDCFNLESYTLCAAGLRAIVEGVCADQGVKCGPVEITKNGGAKAIVQKNNLDGKISGLHDKGVLTKKHADILHELRFLGNEALHELDQPSTDELMLAIDIIQHILDALYEIPEKAETLRDNKARRMQKRMP